MTLKQAVFFDVGNTLLRPYPSVGANIADVLAQYDIVADPELINQQMPLFDKFYSTAYEDDSSFWSEEDRIRYMWLEGYSRVLSAIGIEENHDILTNAIYRSFDSANRWKLFDGVEETFAELKERGFLIGIISNWGEGLERLLGGLALNRYIDTVVSSASVGTHKPNALIFEIALSRLGVAPENSYHVGDHIVADVQGALAVGITPVFIVHKKSRSVDPTCNGHAGDTAEGLFIIDEIPAILGIVGT